MQSANMNDSLTPGLSSGIALGPTPAGVVPQNLSHSAEASDDFPASASAMPQAAPRDLPVTYIRSQSAGSTGHVLEVFNHWDLLRFLVRREIKVRYAQSAIGVGWAVLQPLFPMLIFSVIFGRLAQISSDGLPYGLFSFAGLVPWLYFSNGVTDGVNSLIANANMLSKVYFPRLLIPLAAVIARLVDAGVASLVLAGMMLWHGTVPTWSIVLIPWLLLVMIVCTIGTACWLSTLAIQYRDVKHGLNFVMQVMMYTAPVVYPLSLIPERWRLIYALNPMVGVIEGLRAALLGSGPLPWSVLFVGSLSGLLVGVSGIHYFVSKQRMFADVA